MRNVKNNTKLLKKLCAMGGLLILTCFLTSCQNEEFNPALTEKFTLQSNDNGASYTIKVGLPANYNSSEKYATIYVLDGEKDFDFVSNKCREISDKYNLKNVLVVSIGYGRDRSIDYTPTAVSTTTGGSPEFLHFIESQLIPKIEQNYSADTSRDGRVILGHSYGGLFDAYVFSVKNELFGNYIMLSPSLWFDNLVALQLEKNNRSTNKNIKQLVFMGIGEAENSGRMQAPFEAFYQTLRDNYSNLKLGKNNENNLDHNSSKYPNIDKGLNYYFQNR